MANGSHTCSVQGCQEYLPDIQRLRRHVKSHFGTYIFCPACGLRFKGGQEDFTLKRHFNSKENKSRCLEKLSNLGWVDEKGKRFEEWKPLFNLYYLGLFEDLPIHDEHFYLVAGRSKIDNTESLQ